MPFIEAHAPISGETRVLEVGCGEGGNLKPFLDRGCQVTGVDISPSRIDHAREFLGEYAGNSALQLIAKDIYEAEDDLGESFDLIFMRDVIEHIHDQERFMGYIRRFLKPDGVFFLAFPPWYNPFGGHQQICRNKILSKLPFIHLLPGKFYPWLLKLGGESPDRISDLLEIRETGISIERFERIISKKGYEIVHRTHYFINPNYQVKFGLRPRRQSTVFTSLPFFRNFLVTSSYYLIRPNGQQA